MADTVRCTLGLPCSSTRHACAEGHSECVGRALTSPTSPVRVEELLRVICRHTPGALLRGVLEGREGETGGDAREMEKTLRVSAECYLGDVLGPLVERQQDLGGDSHSCKQTVATDEAGYVMDGGAFPASGPLSLYLGRPVACGAKTGLSLIRVARLDDTDDKADLFKQFQIRPKSDLMTPSARPKPTSSQEGSRKRIRTHLDAALSRRESQPAAARRKRKHEDIDVPHRTHVLNNVDVLAHSMDPDRVMEVLTRENLVSATLCKTLEATSVGNSDKSRRILTEISELGEVEYNLLLQILESSGQRELANKLSVTETQSLSEPEHWEILRKKRRVFLQSLGNVDLLIEVMTSEGLLGDTTHKLLGETSSNTQKVKTLISVLRSASFSNYERFLEILRELGLEHVATEISTSDR